MQLAKYIYIVVYSTGTLNTPVKGRSKCIFQSDANIVLYMAIITRKGFLRKKIQFFFQMVAHF